MFIVLATMEPEQVSKELEQTPKRKKKGGTLVRFEHDNTSMLDENPMFKDSFRLVGFLRFYQKLEGFHVQAARDFALNYDGVKTRVEPLEIIVSPDSKSQATEIPRFIE